MKLSCPLVTFTFSIWDTGHTAVSNALHCRYFGLTPARYFKRFLPPKGKTLPDVYSEQVPDPSYLTMIFFLNDKNDKEYKT